MAGIGDLILSLTGTPNPRDELMKAMSAQVSQPQLQVTGQPQPTGQPATPEAFKTPPDLFALYSQMIDRQSRSDTIDRSLGMIASSLRPGRSPVGRMLMETGGGDSSSSGTGGLGDPLSFLTKVQEFQSNQRKVQTEAEEAARMNQLRQNIPVLAKQLNMSEQQVQLLFESGQLDEFIKGRDDPKTVNFQNPDGTQSIVDIRTGKESIYGKPQPTKKETQIISNPDGSQTLVDTQTGAKITDVSGPGNKPTSDMIEWMEINKERQARGENTIPLEDWLEQQAALKAPRTTIGAGETAAEKTVAEAGAKRAYEDLTKYESNVRTINNVAETRRLVKKGIVSGSLISPYELEGRKILSDVFGIQDDAANNTSAFISSTKDIVLSRVKELGTGNSISNADRQFIEQAVGGDLTLSQESILKIQDILEKGAIMEARQARDKVLAWNEKHPKATVDIPDIPRASQDLINTVPAAAAEELRAGIAKDPKMREYFDEAFGKGMTDIILGTY